MQQNATFPGDEEASAEAGGWEWDDQRAQAALLVAQDEKTDEQIAAELGIHRATLWRWKQNVTFLKRVDQHIASFLEAMLRHGIARVDRRLARRHRDWMRLQQIQEERAKKLRRVKDAAGGSTGNIVHQKRVVGTGENAVEVDEYVLDAALLRELRELEAQQAQDLGQLTKRLEVSGAGGAPLSPTSGYLPGMQVDGLRRLKELREQGLSLLDAIVAEDAEGTP